MKVLIGILYSLLFLANNMCGQSIGDIIDAVDIDIITQNVRDLSGEDSVYIYGTKTLINDRIYDNNDLAADYIKEIFEGYSLIVEEQSFNPSGTNIIATQLGNVYPDSIFIVCGHYDSVTDYCADDNASGTTAVLEAARILSDYDFEFTIKYIAFDAEEIGLFGSAYYASLAQSNGEKIKGVVNCDMIAYDGDGDGVVEIHTNSHIHSLALVDTTLAVISQYGLGLTASVINPGVGASDHSRFWVNGYGAILYIEEYYGGDFNPYYHSVNDRISEFNMTYFENMMKLTVGVIAASSIPYSPALFLDEENTSDKTQMLVSCLDDSCEGSFGCFCIEDLYPNPASATINIEIYSTRKQNAHVLLWTTIHQHHLVDILRLEKGKNTFKLDVSNIPSGLHYMEIATKNKSLFSRVIIF